MAAAAFETAGLALAGFVLCAAMVPVYCMLAPLAKLVDEPGGRKSHGWPVPAVGGLSIFTALVVAAQGFGLPIAFFLVTLTVVVAIGLCDDVFDVAPGVKLALQAAAALMMIASAGVELHGVGDLVGWRPIGLWVFAAPLTVFAVVGVVNAINMIDGMDGLAGAVAFVAFAWYAAVAHGSGLETQFRTAVVLAAAIAGFLVYNLRFPWQPRAKAFLGDAGSLMIGFALAWLAIDLTQGADRSFPPIAALWVVLLPLADCVSLMARRIAARRNPFVGDDRHIHHYLVARGFTQGQTLALLAALSALFGAIGYFGWRLGVPEPMLFWPFFFGFFAYHFWAIRAWDRLERRRAAEARAFAPLGDDADKPVPAA